MLNNLWVSIKMKWEYVKSCFLRSETILIARLSVLFGASLSFIGGLDFSPLWALFQTGTDFTWKQILSIGISVFGAGIMLEIARRRNVPSLAVANAKVDKAVAKKLKKELTK